MFGIDDTVLAKQLMMLIVCQMSFVILILGLKCKYVLDGVFKMSWCVI